MSRKLHGGSLQLDSILPSTPAAQLQRSSCLQPLSL